MLNQDYLIAMNRFDFFYNDVKNYAISIKGVKESDFQGISKEELLDFSERTGIYYKSSGLITYYKHFGKKILLDNFFTIKAAERATLKALEYDYSDAIIKDFTHQGLNEGFSLHPEDIKYLSFNSGNWMWIFIIDIEDNPRLYYWDGEEILIDDYTLTDFFRVVFFLDLKLTFYPKERNDLELKIIARIKEKLEWSNFYYTLYEKKIKSGYIYSINEFEIEFIKFLIEEKNIR